MEDEQVETNIFHVTEENKNEMADMIEVTTKMAQSIQKELNKKTNTDTTSELTKSVNKINNKLKEEGFGVGIADIQKTKTEGNIDTYTIYLTDNTTAEIKVTNASAKFFDIYVNDEMKVVIEYSDTIDVNVNENGKLIIDY